AGLVRAPRLPGAREELRDLDVLRAGDVALPRVARRSGLARVLLRAADVEDRQRRVVEPRRELRVGRQRLGARLELRLHGLELRRTLLEVARPAGDAAEQNRDARVAGQLGELRRRHRAHSVSAVVEHERLLPGDPVAAEAKADLARELG